MKLVAAIAALTFLTLPAYGAVVCKRIGDDPFKQEETLFISGDTGAYSYNAYDGSRTYLTDIECGITAKSGAVCMRVFQREDGLTVEHYSIDKLLGVAALNHTSFTQNSNLLGTRHYASKDSFLVDCSGEP
ncbi:hypothetical protein SAMN05421850_109129 [Lutimaribacter saemankumensis]|uniref:Uncharacterized protein n=2 Tax=Lutimaribacter saemankumensis TaxID=490829 RepID=A0A1G8RHX1_9RHOB|nr:hypothetical protein SAMN05421850_109129 [Lutimaribacter saemankumensis]